LIGETKTTLPLFCLVSSGGLEARGINSIYTGLLATIVLSFHIYLITQAFCEVLKLLAKLSLERKFSRQHYSTTILLTCLQYPVSEISESFYKY
jgi:hypothetical protein